MSYKKNLCVYKSYNKKLCVYMSFKIKRHIYISVISWCCTCECVCVCVRACERCVCVNSKTYFFWLAHQIWGTRMYLPAAHDIHTRNNVGSYRRDYPSYYGSVHCSGGPAFAQKLRTGPWRLFGGTSTPHSLPLDEMAPNNQVSRSRRGRGGDRCSQRRRLLFWCISSTQVVCSQS